jgi:hypothetical protein
VIFRIRNGTPNPLILKELTQPRDLMIQDSGGAVLSWQHARPGQLLYDPSRDEWTHVRARRDDQRRPVFNSGLLAPGETISVRARVRLLEMPLDFRFSYFEMGPEDLRRKVYWEHVVEKEYRYRALLGQELALRLTPEKNADAGSHRVVVFPHGDPVKPTGILLKTVRVDEALEERDYPLARAIARAEASAPLLRGTYTFCSALDAWLLPKDGGHVLVNGKGLHPLPRMLDPERVAYYVDTISPRKLQVELRGDSVASALQELGYPLVAQERKVRLSASVTETRRDHFVFVTPLDLPKLLDHARTLKFTLGVEYGAEASGRLTLAYP